MLAHCQSLDRQLSKQSSPIQTDENGAMNSRRPFYRCRLKCRWTAQRIRQICMRKPHLRWLSLITCWVKQQKWLQPTAAKCKMKKQKKKWRKQHPQKKKRWKTPKRMRVNLVAAAVTTWAIKKYSSFVMEGET